MDVMALDTLRQYLPDLSPSLLQKLSSADQEHLLALLVRARQLRTREHEAAIEAAVGQVPALLRGTVRRMLSE